MHALIESKMFVKVWLRRSVASNCFALWCSVLLMVKHNLGTPSGVRQQLGIAKPKAKAKALELSELGRFFAREYATGRMRATKVGDGAAAASSSAGQAAPDIARFAKAAAPKRGDVKTNKHSAR